MAAVSSGSDRQILRFTAPGGDGPWSHSEVALPQERASDVGKDNGASTLLWFSAAAVAAPCAIVVFSGCFLAGAT